MLNGSMKQGNLLAKLGIIRCYSNGNPRGKFKFENKVLKNPLKSSSSQKIGPEGYALLVVF